MHTIDPAEVRFSQDNASYKFGDGRTVEQLAEALRNGSILPTDIEPIRLVERDGKLFTLYNRRLETFKRAGVKVPYRRATPEEESNEIWKFITRNEGISLRLRGELR